MKKIFLPVVFVLIPFISFAGIKKSDLKKNAVISEEAALLGQVDTVSLYLSSDSIVFAPRLTDDGVIKVETTVLSSDLISNPAKLKNFVDRNCDTFVALLKERVPVYAPSVAKSFDSEKDIAFNVNVGPDRKPFGVWQGGAWTGIDDKAFKSASAAAQKVEAGKKETPLKKEVKSAEQPGKKGCNCPAAR